MDGGDCWAAVHRVGNSQARLSFHFSLSCIGEGDGTPLQCSCLENPGDRGTWWATVYGVTQSRTRLKRLSSSSRNKVGFVVTKSQSPSSPRTAGSGWNSEAAATSWARASSRYMKVCSGGERPPVWLLTYLCSSQAACAPSHPGPGSSCQRREGRVAAVPFPHVWKQRGQLGSLQHRQSTCH